MAHILTAEQFGSWLKNYKNAWENRDARSGAALFTQSATYRDSRFYPPRQGQGSDSIEAFWKDELIHRKENIKFSYEVMACFGDVGICRWQATLEDWIDLEDPKWKGHSGIFLCCFSTDKLVESLEEWREISFIDKPD